MESYIGKNISEIPTPALLVDKKIFEDNCRNMLERAKSMGNVKVRGHMKTHKTVEGGIIQTGGTKRCLVVSTLNEAELYANAGFDDILYGYPLLRTHMKRNYLLTKSNVIKGNSRYFIVMRQTFFMGFLAWGTGTLRLSILNLAHILSHEHAHFPTHTDHQQ